MSTAAINSRTTNLSAGIGQATPPYGNGGRREPMQDEQTFKLEPEEQKEFERALKAGVYRTLHKKGMLTDGQLSELLKRLLVGADGEAGSSRKAV